MNRRVRTVLAYSWGVVSLVAIGYLGVRAYAVDQVTADQARQIRADCPQHRALGEADIQPQTSEFGRDIVRYNRRAYAIKCEGRDGYGPLRPPDPDLSRPIQPTPTPER